MGNVSVLVLSNGGTTRSLLSGTATEYLEVCPSPQAANGGGKPFAANPLSGAEVLQPPWWSAVNVAAIPASAGMFP